MLMKVEKGKKVNWAQIIFNNLCSELDQWYKYVKENKGDKKDTCQSTLILTKISKCLFYQQKNSPHKPQTRVKKTREEMQATLENIRKVAIKSLKNVLKRRNIIEEGGASRSRVKKSRRA